MNVPPVSSTPPTGTAMPMIPQLPAQMLNWPQELGQFGVGEKISKNFHFQESAKKFFSLKIVILYFADGKARFDIDRPRIFKRPNIFLKFSQA